MIRRIIVAAALILSGHAWAVAQSQETQEAAAQPALQGDGWRLVRSIELGTSGNYIHFVLIDSKRDMDTAVYGAALNKICRSATNFCRVRFWNEERLVPHAVSFTPEQFKGLRAEYVFNRAGGVQEMRYACTVVSDKNQCFSN